MSNKITTLQSIIADGQSVGIPEQLQESAMPFRPVKCQQSDIDGKITPINGYLYFTLDTQKIYFGTNSEFLPMGGSSGIYYTNKTFGEEASEDLSFALEDFIDGALPTNLNDLIINVGNNEARNGFYRVIEIFDEEGYVNTSYLPVGGGGSGGSGGGPVSSGTLYIDYVTPSSGQDAIIVGTPYVITYNIRAIDNNGDLVPGSGTATWTVNSKKVAQVPVVNGQNSFDVTPYLSAVQNEGLNNIKVSVSMNTGGEINTVQPKSWGIKVINLSLDWNYQYTEDAQIRDNNFTIYFEPKGNVNAKAYAWFDNATDNVQVLDLPSYALGKTTPWNFDSLEHGAHDIHLKLGATVGEDIFYTDTISHCLTFISDTSKLPVLAVPFYQTEATQYDTIEIPFSIYHPEKNTAEVTLSINGVALPKETYGRGLQSIPYTFGTSGSIVLSLSSPGAKTWTHEIKVVPLKLNVTEASGRAFCLKANTFTGENDLRNWQENGVNLTFSDNFDFINGGIKTELDEKGKTRTFICVKKGTTMTVNYQPFKNNIISQGCSLKFIFKAVNCYDYDAQVIDCSSAGDECSLRINAQNASFVTSNTSKLYTQYYENSYIELELDVWPKDAAQENPNNFIMYWVDGVPTNVQAYESSVGSIKQTVPRSIVVGSDDCDVYIYLIKAYNRYLTQEQHLSNFIIDAPNAEEIISRYNRNDILDPSSGEISYNKLIEKNPGCHAFLYEIPYMTKSKKDKVLDCSYQHYYSKSTEPDETASGVEIKVQGTSSAAYGVAAFNIDSKFTKGFNIVKSDGSIEEAKGWSMNKNSIPVNYFCTKVNVASCEGANNALNQEWYHRFQPYWDGHRRLNPQARDCMEFIPGVMFIKDKNTKTDSTLPNNEKNIFWDNTNYMKITPDDRYYLQYAICNMGNSKKNDEVFHAPLSEYPKACCIEVTDNQNPEHMMTIPTDEWAFSEIDKAGEKQNPFYEFRYPDDVDEYDYTAAQTTFLRLTNWFADNNPNAATGAKLSSPETYEAKKFQGFNAPLPKSHPDYKEYGDGSIACYSDAVEGTVTLKNLTISRYAGTYTHDTYERRMAKMLNECEDYLVMDSIVYHYLFIERHTMVDNVAKNTFWSTEDGIHWDLTKNYDNDTADGNDNSGNLTFNYGLEIGDTTSDDEESFSVFNAPESVWMAFIKGLPEARESLYQQLYSKGAWDPNTYLETFDEFQSVIPERCWIADYFRKYIRPRQLGLDEDTYLKRLEGGKKTHQRRQFENYQNIYQNSKYKTGISDSYIDMRLNNSAIPPSLSIPVTSYIDQYIYAKIGGQDAHSRVKRGSTYNIPVGQMLIGYDGSLEGSIDNVSGNAKDATCYIYYEDMIQSLSNLAELKPTYYKGGNAIRLRQLSIGSETIGYSNPAIKSLAVSNSTMLEKLEAQNIGIPDGADTLGLTTLQSLEEIHTVGSTFKGIAFANGGVLRIARLNAIQTLKAENLNKIETFSIEKKSNGQYALTSIDIDNCPALDSYDLVLNSENLSRFYLNKIDWVVDNVSGLTTSGNFMTGIKVLDHLLRKDSDGNNLCIPARELTAAASLNGTITIRVPNIVINEYEIYSKYNKIFPNLIINYDTDVVNKLQAAHKIVFKKDRSANAEVLFQVLSDGTKSFNTLMSGGDDSPTSAIIGTPEAQSDNMWTYHWDSSDENPDWEIVYLKTDSNNILATEYTDAALREIIPDTSVTIQPIFKQEKRLYKVVLRDFNGTDLSDYEKSVEYGTSIDLPIFIYRPHTSLNSRYRFNGWISSSDYLSNNSNPAFVASVSNPTITITSDMHLYANYTEEPVTNPSPQEYFDMYAGSAVNTISLKPALAEILQGAITFPAFKNGVPTKIKSSDKAGAAENITTIYFENSSEWQEVLSYTFNYLKFPNIVSVYLPDSIQILGNGAFQECEYLQQFHWPNSLQKIGVDCFRISNSKKRSSLVVDDNLPESLIEIGQGAFWGGGDGVYITKLPEGLTKLGGYAFFRCASVAVSEIGTDSPTGGLTTLDTGTFSEAGGNANNLTNIVIKPSVKYFLSNTNSIAEQGFNPIFYNYGAVSSIEIQNKLEDCRFFSGKQQLTTDYPSFGTIFKPDASIQIGGEAYNGNN